MTVEEVLLRGTPLLIRVRWSCLMTECPARPMLLGLPRLVEFAVLSRR